jgi:hypothetical protein
MEKRRAALLTVFAAFVFGAGLVFGLFSIHLVELVKGPRFADTAVVIEQVKTLSHLVTVQYVMEKVVILEVPPKSTIAQFLWAPNRLLLVAHGTVKAGIDLSRIGPDDVRLSGKKVTLKLPPAQITDVYLDEKRTQVVERDTLRFLGFDADLDKNLEKLARENALDDIKRAARTGGILKDADDRAREQVTHFFHMMGFEKVEFTK